MDREVRREAFQSTRGSLDDGEIIVLLLSSKDAGAKAHGSIEQPSRLEESHIGNTG